MSPRRSNRKRRSSNTYSDGDDDENTDARIKDITQSVMSCHLRKGAFKDAEVKKTFARDAVHITEKQLMEVLGCKLRKDGDRLFFNTEKPPPVVQGEKDVVVEAKKGLLTTVLMFIHMSKNPIVKTDKVKESSLWDFLALLGLRPAAAHPVFGVPNKLIAPSNAAEFVAQGWLSFSKQVVDRDTEEICYDWGERACEIVRPMEMLDAYCSLTGDRKELWTEHLKQAQRAEKRAERRNE